MRNEIGSEFWDIPVLDSYNNIFPSTVKWFASGRNAIQAIIAENSFSSVALPSWCCESMIKPFVDKDIQVAFYSSQEPLKHVNTDAIVIVDYFGYVHNENQVPSDVVIIKDITHSVFINQKEPADYYFGSLRKWAGFWTGGYAWGFKEDVHYQDKNDYYVSLRKTAMQDKEKYILGIKDSKSYLGVYEEAELLLEQLYITEADKRDIELANKLDVEFIKNRRKKNAEILLEKVKDIAIFPVIHEKDCPLFVPIRTSNRDELRNYLIQKDIYCPVHWPLSKYHKLDKKDILIYNEELSLVCDQRYDEQDMYKIIEGINEFERKALVSI